MKLVSLSHVLLIRKKRLDIKKATQEGDIPTKVIKQFPNLFIDILHKNINSFDFCGGSWSRGVE